MSVHPRARAELTLTLESLEATGRFGAALAAGVSPPGTIALYGELGSGKTTLVQALGLALGLPAGTVTSPTYTIVNEYADGCWPLYHVDLYRVGSLGEAEELGLEELFGGDGLVCVEWPERAQGLLPPARCEIRLRSLGTERRELSLALLGGLWPGLEERLAGWRDRQEEP